jgi:hypothetical protein
MLRITELSGDRNFQYSCAFWVLGSPVSELMLWALAAQFPILAKGAYCQK